MPQKLRFHMEGPEGPEARSLPVYPHAGNLRSQVIEWIGKIDPAKAAEIREGAQPRPYGIGPLRTVEAGGRRYWFEVSVLKDGLEEMILGGAGGPGTEVRLGSDAFRLAGWEMREQVGWEELACPDPSWRGVTLELATPTAHHQAGEFELDVVLPAPRRYFGSWLGHWNRNAPEALRIGEADEVRRGSRLLELVEARVGVAGCAGQTVRVSFRTGESCVYPRRPGWKQAPESDEFLGFAGQVSFRLLERRRRREDEVGKGKTPDPLPERERSWLAWLARFSAFCGTGVETQRGMGVTVPRTG